MRDETLAYYATHGSLTDPGSFATTVDALPDDVDTLAEIVRGLLLHGSWPHLYGLTAEAVAGQSRATLRVADRLAAARSNGPLTQARPPAARAVGTCRDYAAMLTAFLRHKGVPARVRCGFATYFASGHHEDHWVCEYWRADEARWALADAQLDQPHREHLAIRFDTLDLQASAFLTAGAAWQRVRAGAAEAARFGHGTAAGWWFLRVNLARDLLALGKQETSRWDGWRDAPTSSHALDDEAIGWCDAVANLTAEPDLAILQKPPETILSGLQPFWLRGSTPLSTGSAPPTVPSSAAPRNPGTPAASTAAGRVPRTPD